MISNLENISGEMFTRGDIQINFELTEYVQGNGCQSQVLHNCLRFPAMSFISILLEEGFYGGKEYVVITSVFFLLCRKGYMYQRYKFGIV